MQAAPQPYTWMCSAQFENKTTEVMANFAADLIKNCACTTTWSRRSLHGKSHESSPGVEEPCPQNKTGEERNLCLCREADGEVRHYLSSWFFPTQVAAADTVRLITEHADVLKIQHKSQT